MCRKVAPSELFDQLTCVSSYCETECRLVVSTLHSTQKCFIRKKYSAAGLLPNIEKYSEYEYKYCPEKYSECEYKYCQEKILGAEVL